MNVYTIYVKFSCLPQKREAFVDKMKGTGVLEAIRAEDGCVKYDYYFAESDPNERLLVEQWESKQHQQVHMTQPHMAKLREFKGGYITKTFLGEIELK
jgi:quinol monooxygenase YgiN